THVSGTIHGGDAGGTRIGVAPDARMMHGLVLPGGAGTFTQVAAGMQWAVDPYDATGAPAGARPDIVNMSLGANAYVDEMIQPTRNMYRAGVFPAFAIGNQVFGSCGVGSGSPGNVYEAVGVGATDPRDDVASFSCGNVVEKRDWADPPADWPDQWVTPDLTAPGVGVLSAEPSGSYRSLDGSSMATPHVAGTVALLRQARPDLSVDQLRDTLQNTSFFDDRHGTERPNSRFGWGRIDAYQAVVNASLDSGVTGQVTDRSTRDPIAGATIRVTGSGSSQTVTSGPDGRYEVRLLPGSYTLDLQQFGYASATGVPVEVPDRELVELDRALVPLPTGAVAGTVTYQPTGLPVPGAEVSVLGVPGDWSDQTGRDGDYRIEGLPAGAYRLQAYAPGLVDSDVVEIGIEAGGTSQASFTLARPGATERVSLSYQGGDPNMHSTTPAISGDGRWVGFQSLADNLVEGLDTPWARTQVYLRDLASGTTDILSRAPDGAPGNLPSFGVTLDQDGRHAAFYSEASNLVPDDTNAANDIFVRDRVAGTIERVSVASDGSQANGYSYVPVLSDDGRLVAFYSMATNLDGGLDDNADVFLHDRDAGTTTLVSATPDGTASDGYSSQAFISGNGRYVAFQSSATNLVDGVATDGTFHIFVHDLELGRTELVSIATGGELANGRSEHPKLSRDGRYVTFMSESSNLVEDDTNATNDVFVHDRQTGVTEQVSVSSDGVAGNAVSDRPAISGDGRLVAFRSFASNLVRGDHNNRGDVFVHDRTTGQTQVVSLRTDGALGGGASNQPALTADGRMVAYDSFSALVPTDGVPWQDVYLRDLAPDEPEARFALWGLDVDPPEPTWPQDVTASVGVANIGDLPGENELALTVNGQPEPPVATVTLDPGASTMVEWTLDRRELGDYRLAVGPLSRTFTLGPPEVRWQVPPAAGPRLPVLLLVLEDGRPRTVEQVRLSATGADGQAYGPWPMPRRSRGYQVIVDGLPPGSYTLSVELVQGGSTVEVGGPAVRRVGSG
ncbi:MAG: S8 family serine peptidase, partial [Natronosporangium sp.]